MEKKSKNLTRRIFPSNVGGRNSGLMCRFNDELLSGDRFGLQKGPPVFAMVLKLGLAEMNTEGEILSPSQSSFASRNRLANCKVSTIRL